MAASRVWRVLSQYLAARSAGPGNRFYAAVTGVRAGLVEISIAVFGAWAVSVAGPLLPYAMGLAAGGMLYVISDEIIPETHSGGFERVATLGTMLGVVVILYLDVSLAKVRRDGHRTAGEFWTAGSQYGRESV